MLLHDLQIYLNCRQILPETVMNFAAIRRRSWSCRLRRRALSLPDGLLGSSSLGDIKQDNAYLKHAVALIFDRKVIDQPVTDLARFVGHLP